MRESYDSLSVYMTRWKFNNLLMDILTLER